MTDNQVTGRQRHPSPPSQNLRGRKKFGHTTREIKNQAATHSRLQKPDGCKRPPAAWRPRKGLAGERECWLSGEAEALRQVSGQPDRSHLSHSSSSAACSVGQPGRTGRPGGGSTFPLPRRRGREDLASPVQKAWWREATRGGRLGGGRGGGTRAGHITSTKNSLGLPMAMWKDWRLAVSSGGTEPKSRTGGAPGGCRAAAAAGGAGGGTIITTMGL